MPPRLPYNRSNPAISTRKSMVTPDYKSFLQLSRDATLIPVAKTLSADLLTPVGAFLSVAARQKYAFLLESVEGGERIGRYTFVGAQPRMVLTARGQDLTIRHGSSGERRTGNVIDALRETLRQFHPATVPGLPPFTGGGVGYFAYDMVRQFERLPKTAKADIDLPDCIFTFYDRLLAFDHLKHQLHIIASADVRIESPRRAYDRALADIDALERKLVRGIHQHELGWSARTKKKPLRVHTSTSHDQFVESVRQAKEYIAAGDIFQVVLSQRLDFKPPAEPFQIYRALRTVNPSPYMFFLQLDGMHVLGASPEMLVRIAGRNLEYRPIAGTRRRGEEAGDDERLIEELRTDEKERAEHVMLVDLGRNDLGRVSDYGTRQGSRPDVCRALFARDASGVGVGRAASPGTRRPRCGGGVLPGRYAERSPQGPRYGNHRRAGAGAERGLRRRNSLRRLCRQSGFMHRDSHHGPAPRARLCAGRRRHRRGLRPRKRIPGVHEQSQRTIARSGTCWVIG